MVGAVIVNDGQVIGIGHHRKYGGLHAEREALAECRRRGSDPRGATAYVTLEPCCHHGKQPPCTDALIESGIAHVIAARRDPNPVSGGGADVLHRAGIPCEFTEASPLATRLSDPFIKRITTGLPWVIAKWAQTRDGRLVTTPGEPRWISGEVSRRRVHRLRARVDAVLTGMGTVIADDPRLTARDVPRLRRIARRVVLDTSLNLPPFSNLARTARETPILAICSEAALSSPGIAPRRAALERMGVQIAAIPDKGQGLDLIAALRMLADQYSASTVLLECGPRLLGSMFGLDLIDECLIHVGGVSSPEGAVSAANHRAPQLAELDRFQLVRKHSRGQDFELTYWRTRQTTTSSRTPAPPAPSP